MAVPQSRPELVCLPPIRFLVPDPHPPLTGRAMVRIHSACRRGPCSRLAVANRSTRHATSRERNVCEECAIVTHVDTGVAVTMRVAFLLLSGFSFLGLSPRPPTPEWGLMLATGDDYLRSSPICPSCPARPSSWPCWASTSSVRRFATPWTALALTAGRSTWSPSHARATARPGGALGGLVRLFRRLRVAFRERSTGSDSTAVLRDGPDLRMRTQAEQLPSGGAAPPATSRRTDGTPARGSLGRRGPGLVREWVRRR